MRDRPDPSRPPAEPAQLVFVSHSGALGGAERSLLELARGLAAAGHTVRVLVPCRGALLVACRQAELNTSVVPFGRWVAYGDGWWKRVLRGLTIPFGAAAVALMLGAGRPVVISNSSAVGAGALGAASRRCPHVWLVREFLTEENGLFPALGTSLTIRLIHRLPGIVLANSSVIEEWLRTRGVDVWAQFENPVAYDSVPCLPDRDPSGPLRLGMLGSLAAHKGHADAIAAVGALKGRGRDIRLEIAGEGSPEDIRRLRSLVRGLGVEEVVHVHNPVAEPAQLIELVDVGLVCSRREAFGRVTVEFQKAGRPVIGTTAGETPRLIDHGRTGLLYPVGDVDRLIDAIDSLAADPAARRAMGDAARASMGDRFTLKAALDCVGRAIDAVRR